MAIRDGDWELDHELSVIGERYVWKRWDGDRLTVRTDYPVDPIIEANKTASANVGGARFGEVSHVASIPAALVHGTDLGEAFRQHDQAYIRRFLNDSDNAAWRTRGGRL